MTVTARTRKAVYERDGHECVLARVEHRFAPCFGPLTLQHCVGRGMGGSRLFDTADLLVTMCNGHNTLATADADFARYCTSRGLVRSRNSTRDPRLIPVLYWDGWYRLEGDGKVPVHPIDAVEYMTLVGCIREGFVPTFERVCDRIGVAKVMPRNAQTSEASATPSPVKAIGAAHE